MSKHLLSSRYKLTLKAARKSHVEWLKNRAEANLSHGQYGSLLARLESAQLQISRTIRNALGEKNRCSKRLISQDAVDPGIKAISRESDKDTRVGLLRLSRIKKLTVLSLIGYLPFSSK